MRVGVAMRCVLGLAVLALALANQGCKYTIVPKAEMRKYLELQDLNEKQAGIISELQNENSKLLHESGQWDKRYNEAKDQWDKRHKDDIATIEAQRMILGSFQKVVDEAEARRKALGEFAGPFEGDPDIKATQTGTGMMLSMEGDVLFDSGKHTLKQGGKAVLDRLAAKLKNVEQEIRVSGYTDSDPIKHSGVSYADNMHLSAMRAHSVWKYLASKGVPPQRMNIAGYGQYMLKKTAGGAEDKAASRRAEVLLLLPQAEIKMPGK